jgi:hypothetical protein
MEKLITQKYQVIWDHVTIQQVIFGTIFLPTGFIFRQIMLNGLSNLVTILFILLF